MIAFSKFFKESISFICDFIVSHILVSRYLRTSKLWFRAFTFEIRNSDLFLKVIGELALKGREHLKVLVKYDNVLYKF